MKKYIEKMKDLQQVFIALEEAYDKVSSDLLQWGLEKKGVSTNYIDVTKDIYDNVIISLRSVQ